jgi:hypothetical protein
MEHGTLFQACLARVSRSHLFLFNVDLHVEIRRLSECFPRFGYRRIHALLKAQGWQVNVKRVNWLRGEEGLQVKKHRKSCPKSLGLMVPEQANVPDLRPEKSEPLKGRVPLFLVFSPKAYRGSEKIPSYRAPYAATKE